MTTPSQTDRPNLSSVRALLDNALVSLVKSKEAAIELKTVEQELETALHACYTALASGANYAVFKEQSEIVKESAQKTLAVLQETPSKDPPINVAMRLVAFAFGITQRLSALDDDEHDLPRPGAQPLLAMASFDEPQLIETRSTLLRPHLPLPVLENPEEEEPPPEEPPPITDLEELKAEMQRSLEELKAFAEPDGDPTLEQPLEPLVGELRDEDEALRERFGVVISIEEQLTEQAEECLLDLTNMGRMRRPTAGESWDSGEMTEQRLVRRVDALAACGEAVYPELVEMLADQPIPDPEMTWALIFLFGSLRGDDTFDQAWRIARAVDFDEPDFGLDFVVAVSDAFTYAPHPRVDETLSEWLEDPHPRRREVAVQALAKRRTLTPIQLEDALGDNVREVRLAAVESVAILDTAPDSLLNPFYSSEDEDIARAAMWGGSQKRTGAGVRRALEHVSQAHYDFGQAALLVAIAGGEAGRQLLLEALLRDKSPALLKAVGWLGDPRAADWLLMMLVEGDVDQQVAALEALERISGASISDTSPEGLERDAPPFSEQFLEYEPEFDLLDDPLAWEAWWKSHKHRIIPNRRYRFGHVYSLRDSLYELEAADFTNPQRRVSNVELVAWSGCVLPLDRENFIVRQRRQLDQWREYLGTRLAASTQGWTTNLR